MPLFYVEAECLLYHTGESLFLSHLVDGRLNTAALFLQFVFDCRTLNTKTQK